MPTVSQKRFLPAARLKNPRAESNTPLSGRPCPLCSAIFYTSAKDRIAGEENAKLAIYIMLRAASVSWHFVIDIELRYLNLSTSSKGPPSIRMV